MSNRDKNSARRFRQAVQDAGMTLTGFSRASGTHLTTVSRWANGHIAPPQWVFLVLWLVTYLPQATFNSLLTGEQLYEGVHDGR